MKLKFNQLILICFIVVSCKEKNEVPLTISESKVESFLKKNEVKSKIFEVNTNKDTIITGDKGTTLTVPANCFLTKDGKAVTGNVTIELKEVISKSDMILAEKPTTSFGEILISGGEFYINATQKNENLEVKTNRITAVTPTDSIIKGMRLFDGQNSTNGFNWVPVKDSSFLSANYKSVPFTYVYSIVKLGWLNCDAFYNNESPKTLVTVDVGNKPSTDTRVYFVFKDMNSIMGAYPSATPGKFIVNGQIPIGSKIKVVAFSATGNKLYLANEDITVSQDHSVTLSFYEVTEDELKVFLTSLN